jgi:hypothetical protein
VFQAIQGKKQDPISEITRADRPRGWTQLVENLPSKQKARVQILNIIYKIYIININATSQSGRTLSRETIQSLDCMVGMKPIRTYISILVKMQNQILIQGV